MTQHDYEIATILADRLREAARMTKSLAYAMGNLQTEYTDLLSAEAREEIAGAVYALNPDTGNYTLNLVLDDNKLLGVKDTLLTASDTLDRALLIKIIPEP